MLKTGFLSKPKTTCIKKHKQMTYFDYAATTPCDKRVIRKMQKYYGFPYGNANGNHQYAHKSEHAIEVAQEKIANVIQAKPAEIIFTSGATESNLLAIKGIVYKQKKRHIITCVTEHKSVLDICKSLESEGFNVTYLPVCKNGLIDLEILKESITNDTALVTIMWVNNETGVIQPIKEIASICRKNGVLFHTDAAQALGRVEINAHDVDCMSLSSHKIYGPQGIGALYIKKGVKLTALYGGDNIRPGTPPTALCVGFGEACKLLKNSSSSNLYKLLLDGLIKRGAILNGDEFKRVHSIINVRFKTWPANLFQNAAVSQGAACSKGHSHVLMAMGLSKQEIDNSFRLSLGRLTTKKDIIKALSFLD